jgi:WD40 repeat protein
LSRARNWAVEETIEHGDYVRSVAVTADWIITAGRDEDVKVWDKTTGKLFHIYDGHFEEVTGLVILEGGRKVVSVGIDGTVRIWPLGKQELEKAKIEKVERDRGLLKEVPAVKKSLMTAEEEAELAELMADDDE